MPRQIATINSEGELIRLRRDGRVAKITENDDERSLRERRMEDLWIKLANAFRNWERARSGGGFSDTECCVMPSAILHTRGKAVGLLQLEFSSKGNKFIYREDKPERLEVSRALYTLVSRFNARPRVGIRVKVAIWKPGYYSIDITGTDAKKLIRAAHKINDLVLANAILEQAHERIG